MTMPAASSSSASAPAPAGAARPPVGAPGGAQLETTQGKTTIADAVVSKIAGLAAREVPGVHGFGGGAARAFGALTERIPGGRPSNSQGVSVEVGEKQAAVDLTIVVEYGVAIVELSRAIRRNVIGAVEQMTGLDVVEVNVNVVDLHLPSDDSDDGQDQRSTQPTNRVQ